MRFRMDLITVPGLRNELQKGTELRPEYILVQDESKIQYCCQIKDSRGKIYSLVIVHQKSPGTALRTFSSLAALRKFHTELWPNDKQLVLPLHISETESTLGSDGENDD